MSRTSPTTTPITGLAFIAGPLHLNACAFSSPLPHWQAFCQLYASQLYASRHLSCPGDDYSLLGFTSNGIALFAAFCPHLPPQRQECP